MPVAQFSRVVELGAEPDRVWRTITDVKRLVEWVSILSDAEELEELSRYRATLRDRLGPFKLYADLDIAISAVEQARRIAGHAEGEDRQVGSRIAVQADIHLEPQSGGTRLRVDGTYEVTGRIATLGSSMINNKAQKILDEFFQRAELELG